MEITMMNMRKNTKQAINKNRKKFTKNQIKALRNENCAAKNSIRNGQDRVAGDAKYRGSEPVFIPVTDPSTGFIMGYKKIQSGTPWVRVKTHYEKS